MRRGACLLTLCALALTTAWPSQATPVVTGLADVAGPPRHLAAISWWGGTYQGADGAHVTVYLSARYPQSAAAIEGWVTFFDSLPHGDELATMIAYLAPIDQVRQLCFNDDVVGCYGGGRLVAIGDPVGGLAPTTVAAHEYGHHIAANRSNAPWRAVDSGTKRWATYESICARTAAGTAFPGDEGANYSLNPGEAFAETYRVLVESLGLSPPYGWGIVDSSFQPDAAALAAVRADVLEPWAGPTAKTVKVKFPSGRRTWATTVTAVLDGDVGVDTRGPVATSLVSADGLVVARASWNGAGAKTLSYRDCGQRSFRVRVRRDGPGTSFTLKITTP